MTIGFHLNNRGQEKVDCTNIVHSNPGIGGSEYLILAITTLLSQRDNDIDIILYVHKPAVLPNSLNYNVIDSLEDAIKNAIKKKIDVLVVDYKRMQDELLIKYKDKIKFVIWCHNFVTDKQLYFYNKMPNVLRIINVGREQLDLYRDHPAFSKSEYIYNGISMFTIDKYKNMLPPFFERGNNVIYIGSLEECKGFHHLAKAWKKVLNSFPDANLYVVGSGKLYNRNTKLGSWGIAEKSYEEMFLPFITKDEELLPSVNFMGVMANEKFDLLSKCKVGVPNPGGLTETFGLTAIEMQAMGCLVTTIKCPGYLDTVFDKVALYNNTNILADCIIEMLNRSENDYESKYKYIKDNFSFDNVITQWEKLFKDCISQKLDLHDKDEIVNCNYRFKYLKEYLRIKKRKYKILIYLPSIEFVLEKTIGRYHRILERLF